MFAYTGFAQVYDTFMDNVPYDMWTEYLHSLLKEYGINDGLVLELGCGTGNVTRRLSKIGYDMIGIDFSEEMLEIAREKEYLTDYAYEEQEEDNEENIGKDNEENIEEDYNTSPILYLNQDMREFELFGTVAAVVCICDGMNYITKEEDLLKVFKLANNYLDNEGVFIFDLNTEYKYKNLLADNVIAENREDCSFIWENYYDEAFVRFRETHVQKAYSLDTIKNLIKESGMEFVAAYDAFTRMPPNDKSERLYVIAKEKHQDDKTYII
ncbi:MAG: Methyltransferase type 12 [Anaerocolumna sp.]|nr:Methyltransferase type 12 [Anaerocolumna sp.]